MQTTDLDPDGRLLLAAIKDLSFRRSAQDVMDVVRHAARELTGADGVTFVLRENEQCYYAEENAIAPLWKGKRFPLTMCVSGWVMMNRQGVVIEDIYDDPRVPADAYRATFVQSLAMVPVRADDPIGAIGAYWARRHRASSAEMERLQTLADAAALALANVELYGELTQALVREREARDVAERTNDTKDRFLSILSHELRTPLTSILGWARLLITHKMDEVGQRRGLEAILRNATLQHGLIEDLLDLSAMLSGHLELDPGAVRVAESVTTVLEGLGAEIEKKALAIECRVEPGTVVRADPARLRQMLSKILSNAVKFTPARGRVTVTARRVADLVEIRVSDTGVGIPPAFLPRVFEAFRQADDSASRRHEGLGLGLAIVQHLATLHGGTVEVVSDGPDRGTCVTVRLPASIAPSSRSEPAS
jgi:two-component system CheB/CheR fusion protein